MRLIPSDTYDFAYTVTFFRVTHGGRIRVKLSDGSQVTRDVRDGEYVNLPVRRLYQSGTTASGFNNALLDIGPDRELDIPYAPDGELTPVVPPTVIPVAIVSANANIAVAELVYDRPMTVDVPADYQFRRAGTNVTHTGPTYDGNKLVFTLGTALENGQTCDVTAAQGAAESSTGRPSAALTQYSITNNTLPRPTVSSVSTNVAGNLWTFTLSEACTRTGVPTGIITIGGGVTLTYVSGNGTGTFVFSTTTITCEALTYTAAAGFLTSVATGQTSAFSGTGVTNNTRPTIVSASIDFERIVRILWSVPIANYSDASAALYVNGVFVEDMPYSFDDGTTVYYNGTGVSHGDVVTVTVQADTVEANTTATPRKRNLVYTQHPVTNDIPAPKPQLLSITVAGTVLALIWDKPVKATGAGTITFTGSDATFEFLYPDTDPEYLEQVDGSLVSPAVYGETITATLSAGMVIDETGYTNDAITDVEVTNNTLATAPNVTNVTLTGNGFYIETSINSELQYDPGYIEFYDTSAVFSEFDPDQTTGVYFTGLCSSLALPNEQSIYALIPAGLFTSPDFLTENAEEFVSVTNAIQYAFDFLDTNALPVYFQILDDSSNQIGTGTLDYTYDNPVWANNSIGVAVGDNDTLFGLAINAAGYVSFVFDFTTLDDYEMGGLSTFLNVQIPFTVQGYDYILELSAVPYA